MQGVGYRNIQVFETSQVLKYMGSDLEKGEEAKAELREEGIEV